MSEPKKVKIHIHENIPGCADPNNPFHPIAPNDCATCKQHADYTCWNFFPEGPEALKRRT